MNISKAHISTLVIVSVTSFLGTFLISSVNIALPAIEKTFGLNAIALSWVITSFLLSTAMFLLPLGRLGDLFGIRRLFRLGVVVFTISTFFCGFASSGFWLLFFRFVQGFGAALTSTTGPAILVSTFLPQQRGRVLGLSVSAVYLGLACGPFLGGILTQIYGWRMIFHVSALLGFVTLILTFTFLGKVEKREINLKKEFSFTGTIIYMAGLTLLVNGSSNIPTAAGWILMFSGILTLILFWIVESRSQVPVFDTQLFTTNRLFSFSNIAALINYSATFAIVFLLSLYLQKIKGLSPQSAGTILIAQPVVMALFSPIAGRLSDKMQPRILATTGMSMCALGLIAFSFLTSETSFGYIIILLIWVGLGFALFSSPNMNTIMSSVDKSRYGTASGTAASMRVLGQIASMTIATLFFAAIIGDKSIESSSNESFLFVIKWAFLVFSIISMAGIYFSFSRGKMLE